jgi:hypothetical protein
LNLRCWKKKKRGKEEEKEENTMIMEMKNSS